MFIELIKKEVSWHGSNGVRITIRARGYLISNGKKKPILRQELAKYLTVGKVIEPIDIYIYGQDVAVAGIQIGSNSGVHQKVLQGRDIEVLEVEQPATNTATMDEWIGVIHDWIETNNLLEEWEEETRQYKAILKQVDLPLEVSSLDLTSFNDRSLTYNLTAGEDDFHINMVVEVRPGISTVRVDIVQADDLRDNYLYVGDYPLSLPISMGSIKAAVKPALSQFMGRLNALLDAP